MPIRKLPPLLVNQIAAGEVIERPASVVKELIENSLDAGASRIDIAVEGGGHQLIRVSDDGRGIPARELPLAVAPHATSKLTTAEDLAAIRTLGFRGEALASMASVSRLRLSSRTTISQGATEDGAVIEASGAQVSQVRPAACAPGTVVEFRDLFFNTPARRKFLRSVPTEFGHIADMVARLAMVHHAVRFRLTHQDRMTLDLAAPPQPLGDRWRAQRCLDVLGKDLEEAMLQFEYKDQRRTGNDDPNQATGKTTSIWGMAGMPAVARSNTKGLYLCVNGRPVKDRNLSHAVKEAYRGLIPPDKHPLAVVLVDIDPSEVDVNVHPTKAEVRFRHPSYIHGLVLAAIRQRLLGADLTPSATLIPSMVGQAQPAATPTGPVGPSAPGLNTVDDFVSTFRRMDPAQKGFVYEQVKQALAEDDPVALQREGPDPRTDDRPAPGLVPQNVLQIHDSYIVTQDDEGLLIVDQHALHERVIFEELRQRIAGKDSTLESQRLLMPEVIEADHSRQARVAELKPLLDRIGVEAEPFGSQAVAVHAFPSFLFDRNVEPGPFMDELLQKAERGDVALSNPSAQEAALHEVLDMMACKAAVKAGERLSESELTALLAKRSEVERSSNCPHGRPTTLRLSLRDLARQFGRT